MIEVKNISKRYGDKTVYDDFSFSFEKDKITAILGESGAGKTTLLNIIAGITDFEGEVIKRGDISFIFQTDRLVKNLTVKENLKLVVKGATDDDIEKALKSVGLLSAKNLYPKELSAGMARRVAILRAFLYPSEILLMDEPFINLDVSLKFSLMNTVKDMQKNSPKTVLFITHDVKEAVYISDRVAVIKNGKIIFDEKNVNKKAEDVIFDLLMKNGEIR